MLKHKFKIIVALLIITGSCFAGYIFNDYLNAPEIRQEPDWEIYTPGNYKNDITAETIIRGVNAENKIISTSVNLSCEIKLDERVLDLNILSKSQVLRFYGTALYTINLDNLSKRDIFVGEAFVKIYIDKPELYALNLDAEKTIIDRIERGLLSFGAIKIKPEDYKSMQELALDKMREQLGGEDIKIISEENAKKSAAELFQHILSLLSREDGTEDGTENMTVEIAFR